MTSSNWPFYYLLSMIVDCEYIRDQTKLRLTCGILWWIIVEEVRCRLEAKNNAHFSHISVPKLLWCLSGITFILTKTATDYYAILRSRWFWGFSMMRAVCWNMFPHDWYVLDRILVKVNAPMSLFSLHFFFLFDPTIPLCILNPEPNHVIHIFHIWTDSMVH